MFGYTGVVLFSCMVTLCVSQSFQPNIWTVDTEPTNSLNVTGMTFFHSQGNWDAGSALAGSTNGAEKGLNTYTSFLSGQSQNNGLSAPTAAPNIGSFNNEPRMAFPSFDMPTFPADTPKFQVDTSDSRASLPLYLNGPFSTLASTVDKRLGGNQPLSQLEMKNSNLNSNLDLTKFGIMENNMSDNNNANANNFMTSWSEQDALDDKPFPFSQIDGRSTPSTAKKGPSMMISGKFVDHSKLPVMRVKSLFIDTSMIKMPGAKVEVFETTTAPSVPYPATVPTRKVQLPNPRITDPRKQVNTVNGFASDNNVMGTNINIPMLRTTTPTYVSPADKLKVDDLYPSVPFPVFNTNSPAPTVDKMLVNDGKQNTQFGTFISSANNLNNNGMTGNQLVDPGFTRDVSVSTNVQNGSPRIPSLPQGNVLQGSNVGGQQMPTDMQANANFQTNGQNGQNGQVRPDQNNGQNSNNINAAVQNNAQNIIGQSLSPAINSQIASQNGPVTGGIFTNNQQGTINGNTGINQPMGAVVGPDGFQNNVAGGNIPISPGHGFNQQFDTRSSSGQAHSNLNGQVNNQIVSGQQNTIPLSIDQNQNVIGNGQLNTQFGNQNTNDQQFMINRGPPFGNGLDSGASTNGAPPFNTNNQQFPTNVNSPQTVTNTQFGVNGNGVPTQTVGNQINPNGQQTFNNQQTNTINGQQFGTNGQNGNAINNFQSSQDRVSSNVPQFSGSSNSINGMQQTNVNNFQSQGGRQIIGNIPQSGDRRFNNQVQNNIMPQTSVDSQQLNGQDTIPNGQQLTNGQLTTSNQQTAFNGQQGNGIVSQTTFNGQQGSVNISPPQTAFNGQQGNGYTPQLDFNGQQGNGNTPQTAFNGQQGNGNIPQTAFNGQQVNGNIQQTAFNGQQGNGNTPQLDFNGQQVNGNIPQTAFNGQQFNVNIPQAAFNGQQGNGNTPQADFNGQQGNGNTPQADFNGQQGNGNTPQTAFNGQQGNGNIPQTVFNGRQLNDQRLLTNFQQMNGQQGSQKVLVNGQLPSPNSGQRGHSMFIDPTSGQSINPAGTLSSINGQQNVQNNGPSPIVNGQQFAIPGQQQIPNGQLPNINGQSFINGQQQIPNGQRPLSNNQQNNGQQNVNGPQILQNSNQPIANNGQFSNTDSSLPSAPGMNALPNKFANRGSQGVMQPADFGQNTPVQGMGNNQAPGFSGNVPMNNRIQQNNFNGVNPGMLQPGPNFMNTQMFPGTGPAQVGQSQMNVPNFPGFMGNNNFRNTPNNGLQGNPNGNFFMNRGQPFFPNRGQMNFNPGQMGMFQGPMGPFN